MMADQTFLVGDTVRWKREIQLEFAPFDWLRAPIGTGIVIRKEDEMLIVLPDNIETRKEFNGIFYTDTSDIIDSQCIWFDELDISYDSGTHVDQLYVEFRPIAEDS